MIENERDCAGISESDAVTVNEINCSDSDSTSEMLFNNGDWLTSLILMVNDSVSVPSLSVAVTVPE